MDIHALLLSRLRFAFDMAFPAFAIGLASWLAVLQGLWLATGNPAFHGLYRAWVKVLAVAAGVVLVDAVWVLAANGRALVPPRSPDWIQALGSPSFVRTVLAGYLATALIVGAAAAWRLLKEPESEEGCIALKMAIGMFAIVAPLQLLAGGLSGEQILTLRPARLAGVDVSIAAFGSLAAIALGYWGAYLAWRGRLERARRFLSACVLLGPAAFLTLIAGG